MGVLENSDQVSCYLCCVILFDMLLYGALEIIIRLSNILFLNTLDVKSRHTI